MKSLKLRIAPSILSADFGKLNEAIRGVDRDVDMIHIDVMDGHFVPNLTFGAPVAARIRSRAPLDCHLMIEEPERYIDDFVKAGAWSITIHVEAFRKARRSDIRRDMRVTGKGTVDYRALIRALKTIKQHRVRAALALNPKTPLSKIEPALALIPKKLLDMALIMSVQPGFGGQKFIVGVLPKIRALRKRFPRLDIQIDGGINAQTARKAVAAGANVLVAGSYIFGAKNPKTAIGKLRAAAL